MYRTRRRRRRRTFVLRVLIVFIPSEWLFAFHLLKYPFRVVIRVSFLFFIFVFRAIAMTRYSSHLRSVDRRNRTVKPSDNITKEKNSRSNGRETNASAIEYSNVRMHPSPFNFLSNTSLTSSTYLSRNFHLIGHGVGYRLRYSVSGIRRFTRIITI